jgi:hypothetical protein
MAFKLGVQLLVVAYSKPTPISKPSNVELTLLLKGGEKDGASASSQFQSKPPTTQLLPYTRARSKVQFRKCQLSGFGG